MERRTFSLAFLALVSLANAQFSLIPNGDFSIPGGQRWRGNTSDASISFPSDGGNPGGYGLIDSVGTGAGRGGELVHEGGIGSFPASGDGLSLATLGLVAGETYTFQWEVKNFTPGSTPSAGIKLESWKEGNILGNTSQFVATTGNWVSHRTEYTIDPEATALKVVMLNNGGASVGFDNIGVIQTQPSYALSVDPSTVNGVIAGTGVYLEGATATLRAIPSEGYVFSNWTGEASGSDNPLVLIMDQNKTVGANFVLAPEIPDPASPPVASLSVVNGVVTISVNSFSGYFYQLETSQSLDSDWVPLNEEQPGNGALLEFTDMTPLPGNRFYRIRKREAEEVPEGFGFVHLTNAAPNSLVTSNSIFVSGLSGTATIRIRNGKYSIDGSAYTDADGSISNGQVISLQQMTSTQLSTTIETVLTIDGVDDSFSVTTSAIPIPADLTRPGNLDGVRVWQLPDAPNGDRPDQCWLAVGSHPNGDIYISGHDHINNSMLYRLDPSDHVLRWIGDAETASREVNNWLPGESAEKFHTRPIAHDGRVYVATLDTSNMNTDYLSTRGFHWYGYEPIDNQLLDLSVSEPNGIGWPTLQIVTIQKDAGNNLLYGMSIPTNELVRYDIDRAETTLLGKPSAWTGYFYSNRFMWVDSRGRVYITGGSSRAQWNQGESASTFDHVWYYDPATGFGELQDFPLQGPNALEVGQWDRTGEMLYTADDQGNIYRFTDATASWSFVGRPGFSGIGSGVPKTWVFQLSADAEKIYIGISDVSYPNSIWEYDIATGVTTELARISELDTVASSQDFITGYDSWDADGSFYISSFSMYNGVNVYMLGIDPVRIKAAKDPSFDLIEVSSQIAGSNLSISRTGPTEVGLEVLYEVTLFDAYGANLQTLVGEITIGAGQDKIELDQMSLGLSSSATFAFAEFRLVADGNDYVLADNDKIILK